MEKNRHQLVNRLRKRLLLWMLGLCLSYLVCLFFATKLIIDSGALENPQNKQIIIALAIVALFLAFWHIRYQYRKFDYLVRLAENEIGQG
jgi:membrane protein YdbS with pleckstrin-like domain